MESKYTGALYRPFVAARSWRINQRSHRLCDNYLGHGHGQKLKDVHQSQVEAKIAVFTGRHVSDEHYRASNGYADFFRQKDRRC